MNLPSDQLISPMPELNLDEARVLGVLIEKAYTTPGQYPITINGLISGCNQKSNRDPLMSVDESRAINAVDSLKAKQLATEVHLSGSRVIKVRHEAQRAFGIRAPELAVLAELLLRGAQTVGELRGRASRISPMDSLETVQGILGALMERDEPLVKQIAPAAGSRAVRFVQMLCPKLHPVETQVASQSPAQAALEAGQPASPANSVVAKSSAPGQFTSATDAASGREVTELRSRVDQLEQKVESLQAYLQKLARTLGEDPPENPPEN